MKGVARSMDLPLFDPPRVRLDARVAGDAVEVRLEGAPESASLRWQSEGRVEGEGRSVRWVPESESDQLRVAVRTRGGVAVTSVRANQVR